MWRQVPAFIAGLAFFFGPMVIRGAPASGSADQAWQEILALDQGPASSTTDRKEALALALAHLARQAAALTRFISDQPGDARRNQARVRLAAVKFAEGKLPGRAAAVEEAERLLSGIERDPSAPAVAVADARHLRLAEAMQRTARLTLRARFEARPALLRNVREFALAHPGDRRIAGLLVEIATLFDSEPGEKRALLLEARSALRGRTDGGSPALGGRIADDLRRLDLLGRLLPGRFEPIRGTPVELATLRGRVVVIAFWASWSAPSLRMIEELKVALPAWDAARVAVLGVSLDERAADAEVAARELALGFPIQCDARGWESPLVRTAGINALPTVFVVDREGRLAHVNAAGQIAEVVRQTLSR